MKTVVLIPIKLNNERVPNKNIKMFSDGTPLITFIQRACLKSKYIDEIYVYCSDESISNYLEDGVIFLKRPKYLNENNINSNDIINEFIKVIDADIYVEAHATGPFTTSKSIDECIENVKSGSFDSAFMVREIKEFLWADNKPMNFNIKKFPRTQDLDSVYIESPGAYVFNKETFLKYKRRVGENPYLKVVDEIESRDIDYPQDFEIADAIYTKIIKKGNF